MKFATICPPQGLHILDTMRCAFHMALGQELVRNRDYLDWYWSRIGVGHHVMVDNGAAEPLEERVAWTQILRVFEDIHADEIVLPDVIGDHAATVTATLAHASDVHWWKRAVVPQGSDWDDWLECARELTEKVPFGVLCIPKWTERLPGGREKALQLLGKAGILNVFPVHFLGIQRHPRLEIEVAKRYHVRSIDSGAPIAWAQHDMLIRNDVERFSLEWNSGVSDRLAEQNIALCLEWSRAHYFR